MSETKRPDATALAEALLEELDQWERAYPLSVFPEPDLKRAAALLKAGGMTLDAISASNMRHVISRLAPKVRAALAPAADDAETIERVALALCENALGGKRCPCGETGEFKCDDTYPGQQARAAIRAMRSQPND